MVQRIALLSEEEKVKLRNELKSNYFIAITMFLIGFVLIVFIFILRNDGPLHLWKYIIALFFLFILTYFLARKFMADLREDILSNSKIIDELKIEKSYCFDDKEDRFSQVKTKYVVIAEGIKYNVTEEQYIQSLKSNLISVHKTNKREVLLKVEIINRP